MKKKVLFVSAVICVACLACAAVVLQGFAPISAAAEKAASSAECMALLETSTNRVLYEKNAHVKRPMASTTKILTAIAVIENTENLDTVRKIPDAAVGVEGSSIYLEKGEELSVRDLLYGLMLQSGNDCAEALAILTSGGKTEFADLMNATAKKIGADESHFVTPHGLHHEDHYTTAYDLALITSYALKNPTFAEIVKTKKHTAPWKGRDYRRVIINKNKLLNSFEGCDGVKTGYTKKAGRCLVSAATRDNMQVVCAVLNCGPMFEECAGKMEKAFKEYKMTEVLSAGQKLGEISVANCRDDKTDVGSIGPVTYPLKNGEKDLVRCEICETKTLKAPQLCGAEAGKIKIYLQNELLFEQKLFMIEDARSKSVGDLLKEIAGAWTE